MGATELGRLLGSHRTLATRWAHAGCPYTTEQVGKKTVRRYDLKEVFQWYRTVPQRKNRYILERIEAIEQSWEVPVQEL